MKKLLLCTIVFWLAGCTTNMNGAFQISSARAIGGNVKPDDVKISNVHRGFTSNTWNADVNHFLYQCFDDLLGRELCVKKE
jgi:hypothetical protein